MTQKLTIIIPTYNRYGMLLRVLRYIDSVKPSIPMLILDSSSDAPGILQNVLETLTQKYGIAWLRYEATISPFQKIQNGLERVTTPYVVVWADDDFLILTSLLQEVKFLEEHADFSAVHGEAGIFTLSVRNKMNEIKIESVKPYRQISIAGDTAVERFRNQMHYGTETFYSIHRTACLRRDLALCIEHQFGLMWAEISLGCLVAIEGKTRKTSYFHMLREVHAGRDSLNKDNAQKDLLDWIVGPDFSARYKSFHDVFVAEIVRVDRIPIEDAREIVRQVFWDYLCQNLTRRFGLKYISQDSAVYGRIKAVAKHIPGISRVRDFMRGKQMTLRALLDPNNPYHNDFLAVYGAITAPTNFV